VGADAVSERLLYTDVAGLLARRVPQIIRIHRGREVMLIGIVGGPKHVVVAMPDGTIRRIPREEMRALLCADVEAMARPAIDAFLAVSGLSGRKLLDGRSELLLRRIGTETVGIIWLLHRLPSKTLFGELMRAGIALRCVVYAAVCALHYLVLLAAWAVVGSWALHGSFATGEYLQWVLLLTTMVALYLYSRWYEGVLSVKVNGIIKERVLFGALKMDGDALRTQGPSQLLGRVLEANTLQSVLTEGIFGVGIALIEACFAFIVMFAGAVGWPHAVLLAAWFGLLAAVQYEGYRRRGRWTADRLAMTHDLVEKMVGFRTRLAQQRAARWHDGEDDALASYHDNARILDQCGVAAELIAVRGWILASAAMLLPAILDGADALSVAISIGGILLAERALIRALPSSTGLAEAMVAWRNVRDILRAAEQPEVQGTAVSFAEDAGDDRAAVIACHELIYRYPTRAVPVVNRWNLIVRRGDRVLIEGQSGCGKSTLVSLITGARRPESGLVLLHGLDQYTLGVATWRRKVAVTPQFHENHVFTATFAFNLLMGRRWPPTSDDLREAREICIELGLGDLLARMPSGMFQNVGDYGWQLSHGERSRLFIARSLLQNAEVAVLDESFGALDAATFEKALQCVLKRADTVVVVAHP
jgi:ATP-binding cassette subfamily B protein